MTTRLLWKALCLLVLLCTVSPFGSATNHPDASAPEQGVTFSHVYKIDIPGSSSCKLERLPTQDETGLQTETTTNGENDIIFRHNIRLQTPVCDCAESESFKSLLYRVNGLEEEVNYLKTQCTQGCCGSGGAAGVDTSCSGHGTYQPDTCSCLCNPGWEGPDCSVSSCPDECNDNGRCVDGKCVCHQGYTGEDCSQLMCPDNCNDKGQCVDGKCVCFPHFAGEDCSVQKCPNDCIGNGQCVDGQCICEEGFYGEDCSLVLGPQDLRLVQLTDVSLLVEWESVRGAEYYILTYHPKDDKSALEQVRVPNTENSYLITGLTPGVTYIVQVYAVIKEIQSEADTIEATTDVSAIDGIRVLGQTEVSIEVDWKNPSAEVDHFRLKHTDPAGQEEELNVQRSQEARTKHTIVGLFPGTEYQISVQAIKGTTEGKPSSVTGATDIDAPTNLVTTEVTEDTATVSWDRVQAEIEGYMLSYTSAEGSSTDIPVGRDSTSYRLVGLKPGVLHTVYIWAFKGDKVSRKSSTEAETDIDAPKDLKATDVTLESAFLTWVPPLADIEGYTLSYRDEDGSMEMVEKQLGASENSFAVSGLEMGKRYIVTIIAYKENKRSKVVETIFRTVGLMYPFPMDCVQIMKNGNKKSAIYTVYINNDRSKPIEVYCDMETDGGGWLVLQRRTVGKLDFMKRWKQYIVGFGNMTDEFWIGLDKIYELTNTPTQYELRFDLGLGAERAYAVYDNFKIAPVKQKFKLTIGKYSGTAGDAMTYHQGRPWTTIDNDNDIALGNCALTHRGAWWYKNCHLANPNGKWGDNRHSLGVNWEPWKGHLVSLDFTEMKIRPVGALSSRKRRSLMAREKSRTTNLQKK
ncbi:tenascin-N isoform X3 [Perca fluviatilis]|uniref:tenascin-N isoform X3 n=1 Tax=Perca fluviatilis TaxID=8168 RepID=UPI00196367E6|nr:tenascin-N isoform X3 [Perca fluviatilis]